MPSTYTTNTGIEKIATGEQSGTWGNTTNTNLDLIDQSTNGIVEITVSSAATSGSPNSLPITNGALSNGRNVYIEFKDGGDLGGTVFYQLDPNDAEKVVHVRNNLTNQALILFQGTYNSSNDIEIPNGKDMIVKFDGAGSGATVEQVDKNLNPTTVEITGALTGTTATFTTADNNPQLTLTSTDTDSGHGPRMNLVRNPGEAGADGDNLGQIFIQGYNDAGTPELIDYFQLFTEIEDASDGTEDARQIHYVMTGGSQRSRIEHTGSETIINEDSRDVNFRVETDNNVFGLFVDAGNDHVCINTGTDHGGVLNIETTGNGDTVTLACTDTDDATGPVLVLKRAVTGADDDLLGRIRFDGRDGGGNNTTYARLDTQIKAAADGSESSKFTIKHLKGGSEITAIDSADAEFVINQDSANLDFRVESDAGSHAFFVDGGDNIITAFKTSTGTDNGGVEFRSGGNSYFTQAAVTNTPTVQIKQIGEGGNDDADQGLLIIVDGTNAASGAGNVLRCEGSNSTHGAFADLLTVKNDGRVGIGTGSPQSGGSSQTSLDVTGPILFRGGIVAHQTDAGVLEYSGNIFKIRAYGNTSGDGAISFRTGGGGGSTDTERLAISSGGVPTFTQTSTNTDPESDLGCFAHFRNASTAVNTGFTITLGSNDNPGTGIYARRIGSNNEHELGFQVRNSSGSSTTRMMLHATSQLSVNTKLKTYNSSSAAIIAVNDGNFGAINVGTDATTSRTGIVFTNPNNTVGSITMSGTTTTYNTSSDYRLKENIVTDWDATSRLKQLKPSRFNFKTDKDLTVDGFLAHEVSSIVPEAVTGTKDETEKISNVVLNADGTVLTHSVSKEKWEADKLPTTDSDGNEEEPLYSSDTTWVESKTIPKYQGIDQSKLVPLLVKTIQELEARITALEGE